MRGILTQTVTETNLQATEFHQRYFQNWILAKRMLERLPHGLDQGWEHQAPPRMTGDVRPCTVAPFRSCWLPVLLGCDCLGNSPEDGRAG